MLQLLGDKNMAITLNKHDKKIVDRVRATIEAAYKSANFPSAVAKSIASRATYFRNKGRSQAIRRHPFEGICEAHKKPLKRIDAHLDEMGPLGYDGPVRWICPLANNSGKRSCGEF
ncbi:MAG: hypothetical protein HYT22_02440 [Candidatus Niyogibacteria bacterium]|nr:hypothetical protein [Candidatus Niyogibacteria bacterium]